VETYSGKDAFGKNVAESGRKGHQFFFGLEKDGHVGKEMKVNPALEKKKVENGTKLVRSNIHYHHKFKGGPCYL